MFLGEDGHYMLDVANTGRGPTRFKSSIQEAMVLCWFFHGIWWFFQGFEITETSGCLILIFSKYLELVILWFWFFSPKYLELAVLRFWFFE